MIKKTLRSIILVSLSIYLTKLIWQNINYGNNLTTLLTASLVLTIFEYFLKPILKILLLPISVLTLGIARLFINTLGLYITVYFLDSFTVNNINTASFSWVTVNFPPIRLNSFAAFFVTTFTINLINNWLKIILEKKKKIKT